MTGREYLTPDEAAERLRICTKTLGRLRRDGLIRYVAVTKRKILYRPQDCDDYAVSRAQFAATQPTIRRSPGRRVARTGNVVPIRGFSARQGSAGR